MFKHYSSLEMHVKSLDHACAFFFDTPSTANLSPPSIKALEGLERLAEAGANRNGPSVGQSSSAKKGATKFLKSFGLGTSKQGEEPDEFTHMRRVPTGSGS